MKRGRKRFPIGIVDAKTLIWALEITIVTLVLSVAASLLSQTAIATSDIPIAVMLLIFMIVTSIIFDGIGVSVTSCSREKVREYCLGANVDCACTKTVLALIDNAEKVNNVCADVIGDVCGVLSGACGSGIASAIAESAHISPVIPSIAVAGAVAALTVGGKAALKSFAVHHSARTVFWVGRLIAVLKVKGKREKR